MTDRSLGDPTVLYHVPCSKLFSGVDLCLHFPDNWCAIGSKVFAVRPMLTGSNKLFSGESVRLPNVVSLFDTPCMA